MKKGLILCIILLLSMPGMLLHAESADLIILLDTSKSVFSFFDDLVNYIISDSLSKHLRFGDQVHIITFASKPEIEISQTVGSRDDIEYILKDLLLLQALGNYTDLISALKYLYQYAGGLPEISKKTILILTDGIHDPPPGSLFDPKNADTQKEMKDAVAALTSRDWDVRILNLPRNYTGAEDSLFQGASGESPDGFSSSGISAESISSGGSTLAEGSTSAGGSENAGASPAGTAAPDGTAAGTGGQLDLFSFLPDDNSVPVTNYDNGVLDTITDITFGTPEMVFPPPLGKVGYRFKFPLAVTNFKDTPILFRISGLIWEETDILKKTVSEQIGPGRKKEIHLSVELPMDLEPGDYSIQVELKFPDDMATLPGYGSLSFTLDPSLRYNYSKPLFLVLFVAAGLAVLFGLFMLVMFLRRAFESVSWRPGESVKSVYDLYKKYRAHELRRPIEMRVENQNTKIGMRNVHVLEPGEGKTVGGNGSAYYIFLYPMPGHIAKLAFDGEHYIFTPVRPEYFPKTAVPMEDCLGKPITVLSESGKEFTIRFEEYVSSLEKINIILHLTDEPGLPDDWPMIRSSMGY